MSAEVAFLSRGSPEATISACSLNAMSVLPTAPQAAGGLFQIQQRIAQDSEEHPQGRFILMREQDSLLRKCSPLQGLPSPHLSCKQVTLHRSAYECSNKVTSNEVGVQDGVQLGARAPQHVGRHECGMQVMRGHTGGDDQVVCAQVCILAREYLQELEGLLCCCLAALCCRRPEKVPMPQPMGKHGEETQKQHISLRDSGWL